MEEDLDSEGKTHEIYDFKFAVERSFAELDMMIKKRFFSFKAK